MKIIVKRKEGAALQLSIPSGLVLNRFAAALAPKYLKRCGLDVTRGQAASFVKVLNRYRRQHPGWVLVQVQSADGDDVEIRL